MVGFTPSQIVQEIFRLHKRLAEKTWDFAQNSSEVVRTQGYSSVYNFFVKRTPLIRIGLVIAFLPIVLAFITSLISRSSLFDEGSGTGTYLWLLIITMPVGLLLIVIGLIVRLVKGRWPKN